MVKPGRVRIAYLFRTLALRAANAGTQCVLREFCPVWGVLVLWGMWVRYDEVDVAAWRIIGGVMCRVDRFSSPW